MQGLILHQQQEEEPSPGVCFPEGASKALEENPEGSPAVSVAGS